MSEQQSQKPEVVPIETIDQFAAYITAWHSHKVAVLEHMLQVPEGTEMQVDGGAEVVLEGAVLAAFKAGISVSLMELGKLPFVTQMEEQEATAQEQAAEVSDAPSTH